MHFYGATISCRAPSASECPAIEQQQHKNETDQHHRLCRSVRPVERSKHGLLHECRHDGHIPAAKYEWSDECTRRQCENEQSTGDDSRTTKGQRNVEERTHWRSTQIHSGLS